MMFEMFVVYGFGWDVLLLYLYMLCVVDVVGNFIGFNVDLCFLCLVVVVLDIDEDWVVVKLVVFDLDLNCKWWLECGLLVFVDC